MPSNLARPIRAAYDRLVTGTVGVFMLLVPGGDRTTIGWMLFSVKVAAGLISMFTLIALLPWTGTGSYVSLTGLACVTLILGGTSLIVGWGLGILRDRNCPACHRPMGQAIVGEQWLPFYHCEDCDLEIPVSAFLEPERDNRRREAQQLIGRCLQPAPVRRQEQTSIPASRH